MGFWTPGLLVMLLASCVTGGGVFSSNKKNGTTAAPPVGTLLYCDFEKDACGFENDTWNNFNWTRGEADLVHKADVLMPPVDHTYPASGKGHYIFVASEKAIYHQEDDGRFVGRTIEIPDSEQKYCVELFYYSYAGGSFHIYNVSDSQYIDEILVINFTAKSSNWTKAIHPLTPGKLKLALSANVPIKGAGKVGVAVDDVKVYRCPSGLNTTKPIVRYLGQLDCDFETSMCGLQTENDQTAQWRRVLASNYNISMIGHPTPEHVMLWEQKEKDKALFEASIFTPNLLSRASWCANFYYYIYYVGSGMHDKNLELSVSWSEYKIFTKTGNDMSYHWQHAQNVPIGTGERVPVIIYGKEYNIFGVTLYMAIDDLKIGQCLESVSTTTATSVTTETTTIASTTTAPPTINATTPIETTTAANFTKTTTVAKTTTVSAGTVTTTNDTTQPPTTVTTETTFSQTSVSTTTASPTANATIPITSSATPTGTAMTTSAWNTSTSYSTPITTTQRTSTHFVRTTTHSGAPPVSTCLWLWFSLMWVALIATRWSNCSPL